MSITRLHDQLIAAGIQTDCVSINGGAINVQFSGSATAQQIADGQVLIAAFPLENAKVSKISSINAECRTRLIARFGAAEEQVSRVLGVYGAAEKAAIETGIAATIDASNTASDSVLAAATVQDVEAVSVSWPVI